MSKKDQFQKNLRLSAKLADYIANHPSLFKKHGEGSYVVFSKTDNSLNEMNENLLKDIKKEKKSKKVIKATFTGHKNNPWKFEFAY